MVFIHDSTYCYTFYGKDICGKLKEKLEIQVGYGFCNMLRFNKNFLGYIVELMVLLPYVILLLILEGKR